MRSVLCASALLFLVPAMPAVSGTVYKCTVADGSVAYSDSPCADPAAQRELRVQMGHAPAAAPAAAQTPVPGNPTPTESVDEAKDCSNWMAPPYTVDVDPLPPPPDLGAYPKDEEGRTILVPGPTMNVVVNDDADAITVAEKCSALVTHCFHKNNDHKYSMDACFKSAPRCATSRPWEEAAACCPEPCWDHYAELRRRCVDPLTASSKALFTDRCVPGMAELLDGRTP